MVTFNRVILAGNLVRDPEIRYLPSGLSVTSFGLAVNERIKKGDAWEEHVSFFDVTVFGKQGENCAEYLSKGRPALVEGRLRQRRWEQDGVKKNKIEIIADNVQFLGAAGKGNGAPEGSRGGSPAAGSGGDAPDEDIPF
jgi:single-strand DNA-binding protein